MILISLWTGNQVIRFMSVMVVQTKCKLNNTKLSSSRTVSYSEQRNRKQQELRKNNRTWKMAQWDFAWILTLERRWNAIKQPIPFVKGRLNFSSKTTTATKVPLMESLLDNWLKNNHITVDKIYYLSSLFVLCFQFYFSTAENRKTEFCGNALKLDLIE